jgi:hypothetical protein
METTNLTTMFEIEEALQNSHPTQLKQFMTIIRQINALMSNMADYLYPDKQGPVSNVSFVANSRFLLYTLACVIKPALEA